MPHRDAARIADTRAWFTKAANDLRGAEIDLAADPPLLGDALFHCQQASEKSFKGFLTWHDEPFRKTHSIEEAETALALAREVFDQLLEHLPDEVRP
jgi:HEPN domain-containing protein